MKRQSMGRVRIAVLGKFNVGKSALTVKYLTRRFIGEYHSNEDLLYQQQVLVNGSLIDVEIIDVSGETRDTMTLAEASQLSADGVVLVYSIVDRESFEYARRVLELLLAVPGLPVTLLGNKADLAHLRVVKESEGSTLAKLAGATFCEVNAAEECSGLQQAFDLLVGECHTQLSCNNNGLTGSNGTRTRKFSVTESVTKMLTLIGAKSSSPPPTSSGPSMQGTVVVCQRSDLFRSGVLRRRHKTSNTPSL